METSKPANPFVQSNGGALASPVPFIDKLDNLQFYGKDMPCSRRPAVRVRSSTGGALAVPSHRLGKKKPLPNGLSTFRQRP